MEDGVGPMMISDQEITEAKEKNQKADEQKQTKVKMILNRSW